MVHPSFPVMNLILKSQNVHQKCEISSTCDICLRAKKTRLPFPISTSTSCQLFDLVHCDLWDPYNTFTHGRCHHFLTVVEDYSKCTWIFLLSDKTQVFNILKNFLAYVHTHFDAKIKYLRSDNGTEFTNSTLSSYLSSRGVIQ